MSAEQENRKLTEHILGLVDLIYRAMEPGIPHEGVSRWLASDMTVAQLRVLLLLHTDGPMRMSDIATHLGIALSTATGIIDKLVAKDKVVREANVDDRRQVICQLSPAGSKLMGGLWDVGRSQIARLLDGLEKEQLQEASRVIEFIYANIAPKDIEQDSRK